MAGEETAPNGRTRLEEALTSLVQAQAALLARQGETDREMAALERRRLKDQREADARFVRIESQLAEIVRVLNEHGRVLNEHTRMLERLPEAIREKIGFRGRPGEAD